MGFKPLDTTKQDSGRGFRPLPKSEKSFPGQQYVEPIAAMVSGGLAPIVAGASGALYAPVVGPLGAAEIYEDTRENLTYDPRLPESEQNLNALQGYVGNVMESLRGSVPGQIVSPLLEMVGQGHNRLSDLAADKLGPAAGTTVKALPAAAAEIAFLKGSGAVRPDMKLLDNGQPTPALESTLNKQGLTYQTATPETKAMIPTEVNPGLIQSSQSKANRLARDAQIKQIESGGRDSSLAQFTVEGGKRKPNKPAIDAISNGWEEGTVRMVDTMTPETKKVANRMLNMRWALKKNETNATKLYPLRAVGAELNKRIDYLREQANSARNQLNKITTSKQFKTIPIDPRPIVQRLKEKLDDLKVSYSQQGDGISLDFTGSVIQENKQAQKAINSALRLMDPSRPATADSLHLLKRQLDDLIDFKKKSKQGISEEGRRVLKGLRAETNEALRKTLPEYADVNDRLSSILTVMDDFKTSFKLDINMMADPSSAIGNEMRKIHTRYRAADLINGNILDIDNLARDMGYKGAVDYTDLVQLASRLDDRFGASKSGSFKGEIQGAMRAERMATDAAIGNKPGLIREGLGMVGDKVNRMSGKDPDFDAYLSLKKLLSN